MMRLRYITRVNEVRQIDVRYLRFKEDETAIVIIAGTNERFEIPNRALVDAYWPRAAEGGDDG